MNKEEALKQWKELEEQKKSLSLYSCNYYDKKQKLTEKQRELEKTFDIYEGRLRNKLYTLFAYSSSYTISEIKKKLDIFFNENNNIFQINYTFLEMLELHNRGNSIFFEDEELCNLIKENTLELAKFINDENCRWKDQHKNKELPYNMKHVFNYLCGKYRSISGVSRCLGYGKHEVICYNKNGEAYYRKCEY